MDNQSLWERFFRSMLRIRRVEETIIDIYWDDPIKSPVHLAIGQEAVATGVCEALDPADAMFGTYRSHHVYLAKGGDMNMMMAELYGKVTGGARGKAGSMHLVDPERGVIGTSAVVGTTIPIAAGFAYAFKLRGADQISVVFFGDGAIDEGVFHETLNFAALKKLPVLFICENNFYAVHSHHLARRVRANVCERVETYGISAQFVPGNDVLNIYRAAQKAVQAIRAGDGPQFIECETYRWKEHVGPGEDFDLGYRTLEERQPWIDSDQIVRAEKEIGPEAAATIRAAVEKEVSAAFEFAESSPFPDPSELYTDVFAD